MLGSLARWLRIIGYDTNYDNSIGDDELIECCIREGRVALTRDRRLVQRKMLEKYLFIDGNSLSEQLIEVVTFTKDRIAPDSILSRCLACNTRILRVEKKAIETEVPPYVYQTQEQFSRCRHCGRVYWAGTHRERILERLELLLGGLENRKAQVISEYGPFGGSNIPD